VVLLVGAGFVLDRLFLAPWLGRWEKLSEEIRRTEEAIQKARATLAREKAVRRDWEEVRALLAAERKPDVQNHFFAHLGEIAKRVGRNVDIQGTGRVQQQGDFKEYVYETRFKLTWEELVRLLVELHNSNEFLKPLRLSVASQYEREDRLDLDLRVSTLEYAPVPPKAGQP
jgi:hypothetical protein